MVFFLIAIAARIIPGKKVEKPKKITEDYDDVLLFINSEKRLDSIVKGELNKSKSDTAHTILFLHNILRKRFYHSYSELTWQQNWVATICSKLFWKDFKYPVVPEDILKHPMASCSQQGLVFQDQLQKMGVKYSTIAFYPNQQVNSGHYAVSAFYGKKWHYYDSNLEPTITDSTMPDLETIIKKGLYKTMYASSNNKILQAHLKNGYYTENVISKGYKGRMFYFQQFTAFLSRWAWLVFLILGFLVKRP